MKGKKGKTFPILWHKIWLCFFSVSLCSLFLHHTCEKCKFIPRRSSFIHCWNRFCHKKDAKEVKKGNFHPDDGHDKILINFHFLPVWHSHVLILHLVDVWCHSYDDDRSEKLWQLSRSMMTWNFSTARYETTWALVLQVAQTTNNKIVSRVCEKNIDGIYNKGERMESQSIWLECLK